MSWSASKVIFYDAVVCKNIALRAAAETTRVSWLTTTDLSSVKAFEGTETVSQIFATVYQNTVEACCMTTNKMHWNLASWPFRYSDEIVAVSRCLNGHQGQTLKSPEPVNPTVRFISISFCFVCSRRKTSSVGSPQPSGINKNKKDKSSTAR